MRSLIVDPIDACGERRDTSEERSDGEHDENHRRTRRVVSIDECQGGQFEADDPRTPMQRWTPPQGQHHE